ncbi:hypothetical protein D3C86_1569660 [compost metagenome]
MALIRRFQALRWRLPRIVSGNEMATQNRCAYTSFDGAKAVCSKRVRIYDKRLVLEKLESGEIIFFGVKVGAIITDRRMDGCQIAP